MAGGGRGRATTITIVPEGPAVAQPQDLQAAELLQVPHLVQVLHLVLAQVQLLQLEARREVLQARDLVDAAGGAPLLPPPPQDV